VTLAFKYNGAVVPVDPTMSRWFVELVCAVAPEPIGDPFKYDVVVGHPDTVTRPEFDIYTLLDPLKEEHITELLFGDPSYAKVSSTDWWAREPPVGAGIFK
jgi:hypothetical protein